MINLREKINKIKAEKEELEERNKAQREANKKIKEAVLSRQEKATENMTCPLCQGKSFFYNIEMACFGYQGHKRTFHLDVYEEKAMYSNGYNNAVNPNTYVCKSCGYIIQKMDFSHLSDSSFIDPSLTVAIDSVDWDL